MVRLGAAHPRVLGSRVARLRASHSYRSVLVCIFATFVFAAVAGDATWTNGVLLLLCSLMFSAAVWTSGVARAGARWITVLLALSGSTAVGVLAANRPGLNGVAGILSALLAVATIGAVAVGVIDQGEINEQSITGAICIYILLGIVFLFIFNAMSEIGSGPFFAQGTDGTRAIRLYFSYVTLATLGYGDYTPAGNLGHTLAVVEALLGQLYLVTVVALLVSRVRGRRHDDEP